MSTIDNSNLRVVHVSDVAVSTVTVGNVAHDEVDSGNPIKIGGISRTANPTKVAALDRVDAFMDVVGRQVITPIQIRELITTAYVAITNNSETVLIAGIAGTFLDLVSVTTTVNTTAVNNLTRLDLRSGTAGTVIATIEAPGTFTPPIPIPQAEVAQAWTVQHNLAQSTGHNTTITAIFARNV